MITLQNWTASKSKLCSNIPQGCIDYSAYTSHMCSCQLAIDLKFYMSKDFISLVDPDLLKDVKDVIAIQVANFKETERH
jgi:hypothetical protein